MDWALAIAIIVVGVIQYLKLFFPKETNTKVWAIINVIVCFGVAFSVWRAGQGNLAETIILGGLALAISQLAYEVIVQARAESGTSGSIQYRTSRAYALAASTSARTAADGCRRHGATAMSKVATWIEKKAIPFVEKFWKPIAIVIGVVLAICIGKRIIGGVVDSIFGKVNQSNFTPIPNDPQHVVVATATVPQVVRLPEAVTSSTAGLRVGYQAGYLAKVEVSGAAAIDRK